MYILHVHSLLDCHKMNTIMEPASRLRNRIPHTQKASSYNLGNLIYLFTIISLTKLKIQHNLYVPPKSNKILL